MSVVRKGIATTVATAALVLGAVAPASAAPGTDNFRTYARITYTTDATYAYGTLTIG